MCSSTELLSDLESEIHPIIGSEYTPRALVVVKVSRTRAGGWGGAYETLLEGSRAGRWGGRGDRLKSGALHKSQVRSGRRENVIKRQFKEELENTQKLPIYSPQKTTPARYYTP